MGRQLGELAGDTEQANQLARWLRGVMSGVTVRQLEADFGYINKNRWTPYRNGSALIPEDLLERVVGKYAIPAERELQVHRGKDLLRAARRAERAKVQIPGPRISGAPHTGSGQTAATVDALLRLSASQEQLIEAERKLRDSEVREMYLKKVVSDLRRRQAQTEVERDRAKEEARAALEREVKLLTGYRAQADGQLERARRSHASALELRLTAEEKVVHDQAAVQDTVSTSRDEPPFTSVATADVTELPALDQIGEALHLVDADLAQHERELADLRREIGEESLIGSDRSKIVRGQLADSAGNLPASGDSTSSAVGESRTAPYGSEASRANGRRRRPLWLWTGLVAGSAALLLVPMTLYESRTVGLDFDADSVPHKVIEASAGPSYFWEGVNSRETLMDTEGVWATFTPADPLPAIPVERRLKAKLFLTVPEKVDTDCPKWIVSVGWTITVDGEKEIASGFLLRKPGQSARINREVPSDAGTISLAVTPGENVATSDTCRFNLRLEKPELHYTGWWGPA